ncbi:hypothetical protein WJX81_005815 [Elliptochloris bilobata]|uniref:Myb-like domain-containing protein n=1 Tax=Elliptochloris bilobata TaxID=381761 RepID=A0AAW1SJQ9_9CHLO
MRRAALRPPAGAEEGSAAGRGGLAVSAVRARPRGRARVLVDVHGCAAPQRPAEPQNEYEREREERIRRNAEMLQQLGVREAAAAACAAPSSRSCSDPNPSTNPGKRTAPKRRAAPPPEALEPTRRSARAWGAEPGAGADERDGGAAAGSERMELMELEEYFRWRGMDVSRAIRVDGRYRGWVDPEVCTQYGIAGTADEAWEQNGGGKFTFKIDRSAIPPALRGKGWSDARAFAATQLRKNPNSYFYRHVAPHQVQAQGEWTEDEMRIFLATAAAHGAGDKWGLFASHLCQRVGYQCSAFYREVAVPGGHILDPRFRMTRGGKAIFVG